MFVTMEEAKLYLKLDTAEEDSLVETLLSSSETLCLDILRKEAEEVDEKDTELLKTAMLFAVGYFYEHREEADHKALQQTLYYLLSSRRKVVF